MTALSAGRRVGSLPRFRRCEETAPSFALTARDAALLDDVWRHGLLTTSQIELLRSVDECIEYRFPTRWPLQRRLQKLYHHRYLNRIARPVAQGSLELVYVLDREGARELSRRYGSVRARSPSQLPKAAALEHRLLIGQARVCLAVVGAREEGLELVGWEDGEQVKFSSNVGGDGSRREKAALIPDGFFILKTPAGRFFYYLEIDRSTEPGKTLAKKCRGYYSYWRSGGFAADLDVPAQVGFRVLWVAPTEKRAETIRKAIASLDAGLKMFWVTTEENITPDKIGKSVFRDGASGEEKSLAG